MSRYPFEFSEEKSKVEFVEKLNAAIEPSMKILIWDSKDGSSYFVAEPIKVDDGEPDSWRLQKFFYPDSQGTIIIDEFSIYAGIDCGLLAMRYEIPNELYKKGAGAMLPVMEQEWITQATLGLNTITVQDHAIVENALFDLTHN